MNGWLGSMNYTFPRIADPGGPCTLFRRNTRELIDFMHTGWKSVVA